MTPGTNPRENGWRPAPAWCKPGRFWLAWPKATGDRDADEAAREDCLGLAELLSDHAPVSLICPGRDLAEIALLTPSNVGALVAEYDGTPLRLHAPLWLLDGEDRLVAAVASSALGREMAQKAGVPLIEAPPGLPPVMETDGEGTALVPASLDDALAAEHVLRDWLGLERLVWLGMACPLAATPGARFLAPGLVVLSPHPANHQVLETTIDARARRLMLVELPNARKNAGCYADCLVAGTQVVVPDFEDGRGTEAFSQISAALPDRTVDASPATWLAPEGAGLGSLVVVQPAP